MGTSTPLALALAACAACSAPAPDPAPAAPPDLGAAPSPPDLGAAPSTLDSDLQARMQSAHCRGLSAVIVKRGAIVWQGAYGFADAAGTRPVTSDTLFELASISKTVLSVALMQLVEQGQLALDADVAAALPFPVRNPGFPDTPITLHMLLGHVSSIEDNWPVIEAHSVENADAPVTLLDWFTGYFTPGGAYYSASANFAARAPGAGFDYSNQASALSALMLETKTGVPFDRYCRDHIFTPLGMSETSYRLADLDRAHLAIPQAWTGSAWQDLGHHGFPDYPVGTLRTSAPQLARFLLMFMNGGEYQGARLLSADTVTQMQTPQFPTLDPTIGIIWFRFTQNGETYVGHEGGDPGVSTLMYFRPKDGVGVIVLTNGDGESSITADAADLLFAAAATL